MLIYVVITPPHAPSLKISEYANVVNFKSNILTRSSH